MRVLLFFLFPLLLVGQHSIDDPQAKLLLDEISSSYEAAEEIEASFKVIVDLPDGDFLESNGSLVQHGDTYSVKYGDSETLQDATGLYLINHEEKVIQINDISSSTESNQSSIYNPKDLMKLYARGLFEYAIVGQEEFRGSVLKLIEFKPKDRYASYSKIRLALRKNQKIAYIKVFNKDGTKLTVEMLGFVLNKKRTKDPIRFVKSAYAGYSVEDLRL